MVGKRLNRAKFCVAFQHACLQRHAPIAFLVLWINHFAQRHRHTHALECHIDLLLVGVNHAFDSSFSAVAATHKSVLVQLSFQD